MFGVGATVGSWFGPGGQECNTPAWVSSSLWGAFWVEVGWVSGELRKGELHRFLVCVLLLEAVVFYFSFFVCCFFF
jgi:hypothetical protein